MSRRLTGTIFVFISAFLHAVRYISAAIFGSSTVSWNKEIFESLLASVGNKLEFGANLCMVIGIIYLIWAEVEGKKKK
ncbi:hypothetical protein G5B47_18665 [Paenibacillus sp. 7124]|uniref:Uncharacterized protein n=1 Tax=Paenibacillus apii TaxID=1850370 RepID=A0A6M1PLB8_9BACL|nr:hypothetical protein [Paenibacillus apii]NGM84437.1 hypothetical protein [Paenibacillus apii]NJJ38387.1 hypothetical protein [Paenibacillus apii]